MPSLIHAIEHHAKDKKDLIGYLGILYMSELAPLGWICESKLGGAGSYFWASPDGSKEFHFRNGGHGVLTVKDGYRNSKHVLDIQTEKDCRDLVKLAKQ